MSNFFTKLTSAVSVATLVAVSTSVSLVSAASEFYADAQVLADNGIIGSQSTEAGYRLGANITRAEMAKVVANLGAIASVPCTGTVFGDVGTGLGDLCGYVEALADAGVVSSTATLYRPGANITRAEMVKMMLGALGETGSDVDAGYMDLAGLGDLAGYVNRANEIGCVGAADYFRPNASSSRGEAFKVAAICAGLEVGTVVPPVDGTGVVVTPIGTGTTVAGALTVSLSGTAMAQYVPKNASSVKVGTVQLAAATSDVTVNSITVTRSGLGPVADIYTVSLAQNGSIVSDNRALNSTSQTAIVRFTTPVTIKAGTSASYDVLVSLASGAQPNSQHQFAVTAVTAGSSTVGGLPVTLGLINTTSYTATSVNVATITTAGGVTSGKTAQRIVNVKIDGGSNRDTTITAFTLSKDTGEDFTKAFTNMAAYRNGTKVGNVVVTSDKVYVTGLNTTLLAGESADFELRADTIYVGAVAATTFKINDTTDVSATETTTGYAAAVTAANTAYSLQLNGVQISWTKTSTGSKTVAPGTSSVSLFDAKVSSDATFDITNYTLTATSPVGFNAAAAAASFSRLVLNVDGIETDLLTVANPASVSLSSSSDKFRVEPGKSVSVKVTGTLKSNAVSAAYRFTVALTQAKNVSNGNTVSLSSSQAGDSVTVSNGKATFKSATVAAPSIKKLTANTSMSEIGRFAILAEAEDVTVRKLVFTNYSPVGSVAQVDTVTPTVVNNTTYTVTVNGTPVSYVSDATATLAEITAGLTAAINANSALNSLVTAVDTTTTVTITAKVAGAAFTATVGASLATATTTANVGSLVNDLTNLISGNAVKLYDVDTGLQINASITVNASSITADSISFIVYKDTTKNIKVMIDTTALTGLSASTFTLRVVAPTAGDITRQSTGNADLVGAVLASSNVTGEFVAASSTYTAGKVVPTVTVVKNGTDLDRFTVTVTNLDPESAMTLDKVTIKATQGFLNGTTAVTWDGKMCVRNGATGNCGVTGVSTALSTDVTVAGGYEFTLAGTIPNLSLVKNNGSVSFEVYAPNLPYFSAGGMTFAVTNVKYDGSVAGEDFTGVSSAKIVATK